MIKLIFVLSLWLSGLDLTHNKCEYLPDHQCNELPQITEVCWSVTNYWPFTMTDEGWVHTALNGQADEDPFHTAVMWPLTVNDEMTLAAGPIPLLGMELYLPGIGVVRILDTFGDEVYQNGVFYHDIYQTYVIGVDVLTDEPLHYLECGGILYD